GWRYAWVMPLMELLFGAVFLRALFTRTYVWRGVRYRVERGGRIVSI
ncbi:MAG: hypothetical protein JWN15_3770, partial [Firmicutes bacterium]|nr:hypothetical protein [Bacillota bacterium]